MALIPFSGSSGGLPAAQDFYRLRREGIGHIEQAGSADWTDYNTHDPGISILEVLAYTITDLAYRTGFPIEDILASTAAAGTTDDPYPGQTFFSARSILTVNPTTAQDFRRLLIDVDPVRNAWVRCSSCPCDGAFYAWCEDDELVLSHDPSTRADPKPPVTRVAPRGLYDVLLELEADPTFGDLNDRKITLPRTIVDGEGRRHTVTIELRFPTWELARRDERDRLAEDSAPFSLTVAGPNRTTTGTAPVDDAELRRHWFDVFYVDYEIELADTTRIPIQNASVRLFGDGTARREVTVAQLLAWLGDATAEGFVDPYRRKLSVIDDALFAAASVLHSHRNLDEDYCHLELIDIDDIAVCADVEVAATADIELVQARIWYEIERYLDPPVEFWSLGELRERGEPVESIFNGPELTNGFLTEQGLRETDLRTELRVSDILNRLIDIDGVVSVDNLMLTAYDGQGNPITGMADPDWSSGVPVFDPDRVSAAWFLVLSTDHRPRLHRRLSQFLFSSRGLPFVPRLDEAEDTLVQLNGQAARPKIRSTDLDLPTPPGRSRQLEAYHAVQHSFPLVYGIGPAGLPSTATIQRNSQAQQLKAYLMVYEQLLRNAFAQVAHTGDLFSLDPTIGQTYFAGLLGQAEISGYSEVVDPALTESVLTRLVESPAEFLERRNRFLDHLLARFGESFSEYGMLLTDLEGEGKAREDLIRDKIAFLEAFPRMSHDRGKAFDRAIAPCDPDNASGLQQRVNLLLGLPDWSFVYSALKSTAAGGFDHSLILDELGTPIVSFTVPSAVAAAVAALITDRALDTVTDWTIESTSGQLTLTTVTAAGTASEALLGREASTAAETLGRELVAAQRAVIAELIVSDRYSVIPAGPAWKVTIADGSGSPLGTIDETFGGSADGDAFVALMTTWAAHKRAIVVEHLLLRPKFPGDALYPACSDGACCGCGDEDPYSFRLTYAMPGWTEPFSTNLNMRGFADRTIQEQTPSHLIVKTCWVANDGYVPDPCHPVIDAVAAVLADHMEHGADSCACAAEVYDAYAKSFQTWFDANTGTQHPADVLAVTLAEVFADVDLSVVPCAGVVDADVRMELDAVLVPHFVDIAVRGYQFERFEAAWCAWADADAAIDWTEERLHDTVLELLTAGSTTPDEDHDALCACATMLLAEFGTSFREWMDAGLDAGIAFEDLPAFSPAPPTSCTGVAIAVGVAGEIRALLMQRYARYAEVSYRLAVLVGALAELRNTYPRATLHDCDEGSDFNPVRLGQTALGSN